MNALGETPEFADASFNAPHAAGPLAIAAGVAVAAIGIYAIVNGRFPWQKKT